MLSQVHRKQGVMSSGIMFLFWFILTILAIPQFRDEIREFERREETTIGTEQLSWVDYEFISYMIYFPLILVQLLAHLFSDRTPSSSRYAHVKSEKPSPEPKASFIRKIMFLWFDSMAWKGFRNPLEAEDMWDINPEDRSDQMNPRFDKYWKLNVEKNARIQQKKNNDDKLKSTSKATHVNFFCKKDKNSFLILYLYREI